MRSAAFFATGGRLRAAPAGRAHAAPGRRPRHPRLPAGVRPLLPPLGDPRGAVHFAHRLGALVRAGRDRCGSYLAARRNGDVLLRAAGPRPAGADRGADRPGRAIIWTGKRRLLRPRPTWRREPRCSAPASSWRCARTATCAPMRRRGGRAHRARAPLVSASALSRGAHGDRRLPRADEAAHHADGGADGAHGLHAGRARSALRLARSPRARRHRARGRGRQHAQHGPRAAHGRAHAAHAGSAGARRAAAPRPKRPPSASRSPRPAWRCSRGSRARWPRRSPS